MKLFIRRSQQPGGFRSRGNVVFTIDVRVEPTASEKSLISKYRLGSSVVYDSNAKKAFGEAAEENRKKSGLFAKLKSLLFSVFAAFSLRCTFDSLTDGQHIECASLNELIEAEQAIIEACKTAKTFLDVAGTFNGREEVMEF